MKYPTFGTWALLMIFQFIACFVLIPLSAGTIIEVQHDLGEKHGVKSHAHRWDWFIAFLVVAIFAGALYLTIDAPALITDRWFMNGYSCIIRFYTLFAYAAAISCLAGFLYTSRVLGNLLKKAGEKVTDHKKDILERMTLPLPTIHNIPDAAVQAAVQEKSLDDSLSQTGTDLAMLKDEYTLLRKYFTIFFVSGAFLLSMVVFQTGALFSGINSLDLMRYLNAPTAYYLMRPDFIYLLGGVYSLLLLIFYLPVKVSMVNLENKIPDLSGVADAASHPFLPTFSNGLRTLVGVVAASSPFLVSILQYIISSLAGGK